MKTWKRDNLKKEGKKLIGDSSKLLKETTEALGEDISRDISAAQEEFNEHFDQYGSTMGKLGLVTRLVALVHVVLYLALVAVIWTNSQLIGYGAHIWLMPSAVVCLFVLYYNYNIGSIMLSKPNVIKNVFQIIQIALLVGVFVCDGLYIIKYGMDANHCEAVRGGTFSWVGVNNGTLPGIGLSAASPVVCTNAVYGQWVTVNIIATASAAGTIVLILLIMMIMWYTKPWNMLTAFYTVFKDGLEESRGEISSYMSEGVPLDSISGSIDGFLQDFKEINGHTYKPSYRV
jgi:hypothetical protein